MASVSKDRKYRGLDPHDIWYIMRGEFPQKIRFYHLLLTVGIVTLCSVDCIKELL